MARSRVVTIFDRRSNMLDAIGNPRTLTVSVAFICVVIFLTRVSQPSLGAICLIPSRVFTRFEIYRIITAPFFHGGILHILFNMVAWMIIARDFERTTGTLAATYTVFVLLIPLIALVHCTAAYFVDALASTTSRFDCAVGISGVLFALLVVNVELSAGPSVSVFGLFSMPSRWYPLALALFLQLLSPGLSLLGHLSGIALGYSVVFGYLGRLTPSDDKFEEIEDSCRLTSLPLWQPVMASTGFGMSDRTYLPETVEAQPRSLTERLQAGWSGLTSFFSRNNNGDSRTFTGHGRALGGDHDCGEVGRVPPTSRLIQEAERKDNVDAEGTAGASTTTQGVTPGEDLNAQAEIDEGKDNENTEK